MQGRPMQIYDKDSLESDYKILSNNVASSFYMLRIKENNSYWYIWDMIYDLMILGILASMYDVQLKQWSEDTIATVLHITLGVSKIIIKK